MTKKKLNEADIEQSVKDYRNFAFKNNIFDVAIAFILANTFNKVVNALSENILMPLINYVTRSASGNWRNIEWHLTSNLTLEVGKFLGTFTDFIIISVAFYCIYYRLLKPISEEIMPSGNTTCPFCCSSISIQATKCPFCTSKLKKNINGETPTDNTRN